LKLNDSAPDCAIKTVFGAVIHLAQLWAEKPRRSLDWYHFS